MAKGKIDKDALIAYIEKEMEAIENGGDDDNIII